MIRKVVYEIVYKNYGVDGPDSQISAGLAAEGFALVEWIFQYIIIIGTILLVLAGIYYIFSLGNDDGK